jgi:hypothetical protein
MAPARKPTAKLGPAQRAEKDAPIPFDEALRRLVNTPPKPKPGGGKKQKKKAPGEAAFPFGGAVVRGSRVQFVFRGVVGAGPIWRCSRKA